MLCGMSDMPLLRQGVAALNATPPGQWHITQVPRWLPSLAEGCKHIVFFAGTPAAKEGRSFISEIDLQSGPTQLGFDFLVLGKSGPPSFPHPWFQNGFFSIGSPSILTVCGTRP